ncbi:MAG TPA: carbonic anhydrase [Patescibacteria group bacterium]|nr:carbonic anhydrase [Patescibacteria group bacterium]
MAREKTPFVAAADCIDGRTSDPLKRLAQRETGAKRVYVDATTAPGMVGRLSRNDRRVIAAVEEAIGISIDRHGSDRVYVVGHAHCAGNRVEDREHMQHVLDAADVVRRLVPRTKGGNPRTVVVPTFVAPDTSGRWRARPLRRS